MKKKILLPTDFSKSAWNALKYSSKLYKNEDVDFFLLNGFMVNNFTLENMNVPEPGEKWYEVAKNRAELEMQKLLKHVNILDIPSNHKYFTHTVYNSPLEAVIQFVEDKDIDMVIAAAKGESDKIGTLMGSNSIDFMEYVRNCPVLIVPADISFKEPNEIVFPTSYKTHFKRRELSHLCEIAKITNAPIRILYVANKENLTQDQKAKKSLLEECFEGLEYSFHTLKNTDVLMGLNIFVQSRNSEMIAFINKKHAFLATIFSKTMVKDLGFNAKVPVLALHDLHN